ncbi:hypothetical protein [Streptomyces sp. DH10]|uniref:hypothetical protein n=1 Tax=Streptomyces sp. DH10 TaxID=3040121 RepID=UPI002443598C|nr:hypothetical protein [Streptomyces sp. DH10]MDG9711951.1 hypothetical protein [Streptomyces sp. DH10]
MTTQFTGGAGIKRIVVALIVAIPLLAAPHAAAHAFDAPSASASSAFSASPSNEDWGSPAPDNEDWG